MLSVSVLALERIFPSVNKTQVQIHVTWKKYFQVQNFSKSLYLNNNF